MKLWWDWTFLSAVLPVRNTDILPCMHSTVQSPGSLMTREGRSIEECHGDMERSVAERWFAARAIIICLRCVFLTTVRHRCIWCAAMIRKDRKVKRVQKRSAFKYHIPTNLSTKVHMFLTTVDWVDSLEKVGIQSFQNHLVLYCHNWDTLSKNVSLSFYFFTWNNFRFRLSRFSKTYHLYHFQITGIPFVLGHSDYILCQFTFLFLSRFGDNLRCLGHRTFILHTDERGFV